MRRHVVAAALSLLTLAGCATDGPAATPAGTTAAASASSQQPTPSPSATTASASPSASATPSAAASDTPTPAASSTQITPTPRPTPTPQVRYVLRSGAVDPLVRELQARLRQLGLFGFYDVIQTYGPATTQGVANFQANQGLPDTGDLDETTWATLKNLTKAPSEAELTNMVPGAPVVGAGEGMKEVQQRLSQLGLYGGALDGSASEVTFTAIRQFQTNQGIAVTGEVDQRTYDRLASVTHTPTPPELRGESTPMGGFYQELDPRCVQAPRAICASMGQNRVSWVVGGKAVLTLEARYGSTEHPSYPGVFHVWLKDPMAMSTIFGETIPMPYSMFFDNDRGVHYSETFKQDGYLGTSHGCVNVRDYDVIKWWYSQVNIGDMVVVY